MNKIISLCLIVLFFSSCKEGKVETEILINSNNSCTEFLNKEIEGLKLIIKNKHMEQPKLYKEYYDRIITIEGKVRLYSKLNNIKLKKESLKEIKYYIEQNSEIEEIKFNSLKLSEHTNPLIFNSVAQNDISRGLYSFYKEQYVFSPAFN